MTEDADRRPIPAPISRKLGYNLYVSEQFGKRIGDKEEDAFLTGNGVSKPIGILHTTGGAEVGVTTAGAAAITGDELIDLVYSLRAPYRKSAVFVLNDTTVKLLRKLKDGDGQYLWRPGITENAPDTILGHRIVTSEFMPGVNAGNKGHEDGIMCKLQ